MGVSRKCIFNDIQQTIMQRHIVYIFYSFVQCYVILKLYRFVLKQFVSKHFYFFNVILVITFDQMYLQKLQQFNLYLYQLVLSATVNP